MIVQFSSIPLICEFNDLCCRCTCAVKLLLSYLKVFFKTDLKMIEVCIDSLESAYNAMKGGADELELCSSLVEGGLTPSSGLVVEVMSLVKSKKTGNPLFSKPKVNVMIRCRGGSDFCYSKQEMVTMLADIEVLKSLGVDRFVFGALTDTQEIDKINCAKVIEKAHPIPVTFHRAFDLCVDPKKAIEDIIELGFKRLLTSGKQISVDDDKAIELLTFLLQNFSNNIEIMPGAGINCDNAHKFVEIGFTIIHSSCKITRHLPVIGNLRMGSNEIYVTDENIVREMKKIIKQS